MPRGSSTFHVAASKDEVAPVLLVRILNLKHIIDGSTQSLYLTDYQEPNVLTIDFFDEHGNPQDYACCNVRYDHVEVSTDNTLSEVEVTIDNVDRTFSAAAQYYKLHGAQVHVLTAERSVLHSPEGAIMRFAGPIREARINEHMIKLRVTNGYSLYSRIPKRLYDSKHYPYIPSAKDPRTLQR